MTVNAELALYLNKTSLSRGKRLCERCIPRSQAELGSVLVLVLELELELELAQALQAARCQKPPLSVSTNLKFR
jgi:hypothetical protein